MLVETLFKMAKIYFILSMYRLYVVYRMWKPTCDVLRPSLVNLERPIEWLSFGWSSVRYSSARVGNWRGRISKTLLIVHRFEASRRLARRVILRTDRHCLKRFERTRNQRGFQFVRSSCGTFFIGSLTNVFDSLFAI